MRRRDFIALIGGALAVRSGFVASPIHAQQSSRTYRIGFLATSPPQSFSHLRAALTDGLRERGYLEGQHFTIDLRHADGKPERLPEVARALVAAKPDVIVTSVNSQTRAARDATRTIPIVMCVGTDVVEEGFVASLARPGGNITGVTWDVGLEVMPKRFDFLKDAVPGLKRVAVLWDQGQDAAGFKRAIAEGGAATGLALVWIDFGEDLEQVFAIAARERAQALFTGGGARLFGQRKRIVELAAKYRLPDTHYTSEFVDAGGLMSYAPNLPDLYRRAAVYIDKILRGAKPADLPVERPVKLDLVINLKTAKVLGLTIPQSLLLRADRVIE